MANREVKAKQIERLAEGLRESQAVVFADYSGLSVGEVSGFRKRVRELSAEFMVAKNTLIKLAAERAKLPAVELTGPTAVFLSGKGDPIECVKALVSFIKEVGKGKIKSGIFDGLPRSAAEMSELALIPSRAVLESRLVGLLNAPVMGLVSVLQANQRNLVSVLSEVAKSKGGEGS